MYYVNMTSWTGANFIEGKRNDQKFVLHPGRPDGMARREGTSPLLICNL
jgi:hypothetical protein